MQETQSSPPSSTTDAASKKTLILALGVFVFIVIISDIVLLVLMRSPDLRFYFRLQDSFLVIQIFLLIVGTALALTAWLTANKDLKRIQDGVIPVSAKGGTKTGKILGFLGTFLSPAMAVIGLLFLFTSARIGAVRDAMKGDLDNLTRSAYEYRSRPAADGGGGGTFVGYTIPGSLSVTDYAKYFAAVVHPDTVQLTAETTLNFPGTITIMIDSTGKRAGPWSYTGNFQF